MSDEKVVGTFEAKVKWEEKLETRIKELERQLADADGQLKAVILQRKHLESVARSLERDYDRLTARFRALQWVIRTQAGTRDEIDLRPRAFDTMAPEGEG